MFKPHVGPLFLGATALLLLAPDSNAQATIFTKPSGYTTITADPAVDASTPTYTFVSHSLAQKRKVAATLTGGGVDTLTVTGAGWGTDDFAGANGPHYALIATGSTEGDIIDIVSNDADTLTLTTGTGDLSGLVGESITIYQHNTLASVFGTDPTVNGLVGGLDANTADQIIFYDGTAFKTYFYKNVDIPIFLDDLDILGWVTSNDIYNDYGDTPIPPNKGFIIMRRALTSLDITAFGDVVDDSINVPIVDGYNLICVPYPVPGTVTLTSSGLYDAGDPGFLTSLQPGLDSAGAELVVLWNGSSYVQYFYKNVDIPIFLDDLDILGWVTSNDIYNDYGATPLDGSFFILRKSPNPPLDWVFPTVVSP